MAADFLQWLLKKSSVTENTAVAYAGHISAALRKHGVDPENPKKTSEFYRQRAVESPGQLRVLRAAWGYFQKFALEVHGKHVVSLPTTERARLGPPENALYTFRASLEKIPLAAFVELRWQNVRVEAPHTPHQRILVDVLLDSGKRVCVQLTPKGAQALDELRRWAWPRGVPVLTALLMPDTPEAEMGYSPGRMRQLLNRARAVRLAAAVADPSQVEALAAPGGISTLPELPPLTLEELDPVAQLDQVRERVLGPGTVPVPPDQPVFGPGSVSAGGTLRLLPVAALTPGAAPAPAPAPAPVQSSVSDQPDAWDALPTLPAMPPLDSWE